MTDAIIIKRIPPGSFRTVCMKLEKCLHASVLFNSMMECSIHIVHVKFYGERFLSFTLANRCNFSRKKLFQKLNAHFYEQPKQHEKPG